MISGMGLQYMGRGTVVEGQYRQGQVYGNRRGPTKIRPETDGTVQFTLHS